VNKTENILAPRQKIACVLFGCLFFVSMGFAQQRKLSPAQQDKIRLKNERREKINQLIKQEEEGALIYQTEDYQNDWKAETADGTPLPNGVYYFHLQHLKKPIVHKGFIQVIR
jgi:hypothetical protein